MPRAIPILLVYKVTFPFHRPKYLLHGTAEGICVPEDWEVEDESNDESPPIVVIIGPRLALPSRMSTAAWTAA